MKKINKENILPIFLAISTYLLSYYIPKVLVTMDRVHFVKYPIDDKLPLIAPFIIIYICAFGQWANAMLILARQNKKTAYRYASAVIIGSLIGLVIFLAYPTGITRPEISVNNFFDFILATTFKVDSIVNALPSFHCFCSTIVLFIIYNSENVSINCKIFNVLFSLLVFASTLFTKQHFIIDIPTGILLAIISSALANKITFTKTFDYLNDKLLKRQ